MTEHSPPAEAETPGIPERGTSAKKSAREPRAPARAMSIHAHPDDQEFTVGGTLAKWARAGCQVVTVCITSGNAGSNEHTPPSMTREVLAPIRELEQREACGVLGISEVLFMGYEDGVLEPSIALRRDLTRIIRKYQPEAIVCGDPTVRFYGATYMNHPDHRAASDAVLDAVFPSAETRLIFPELLDEGLHPHKVQKVFIHGSDRAGYVHRHRGGPRRQDRGAQAAQEPDGHLGSHRDDHHVGAPAGREAQDQGGGILPAHAASRALSHRSSLD